jgi:hypothetical protein
MSDGTALLLRQVYGPAVVTSVVLVAAVMVLSTKA